MDATSPAPMPSSQRTDDRPISLADRISSVVGKVAELATADDKAKVDELVAKAKACASNPTVDFVTYTPGMAALLILQHNRFNRSWTPDHVNGLAQMMMAGEWRQNSQGYALYGDAGDVGDGSHRLRAQCFSSTTLTMVTYFGMNKDDVATLDCGKPRTAADAAELEGIVNAQEKGKLLQAIWAYERAAGLSLSKPSAKNIRAVTNQVKLHDGLLQLALDIGNIACPEEESSECLVDDTGAAKIAGILLRHKWPRNRIEDLLEKLQMRDFDSDKAPLAKAREYIERNRKPDFIINSAQEVQVVIKAMLMQESGRTAVNQRYEREIQGAVRSAANPTYPVGPFKNADD
jgi:hypothetical protein